MAHPTRTDDGETLLPWHSARARAPWRGL